MAWVSADFYRLPMWRAAVYQTLVCSRDQLRPMVVREMTPNPTDWLLHAACKSGDVMSNWANPPLND